MGKIVITENVSLDGLADGRRLFDWIGQVKGEAAQFLLDEARGSEALLLGRLSYEFFAARWPSRGGEYADRLNSMPKYVVSSTLSEPDWNNSTVLTGDVVEEVTKLKEQLAGEIIVPASYQLGRTLLEHDLVDELRLVVFPVVLGAGERMFSGVSERRPLRLVRTQTIGDGLVFLTYERARNE